MRGGENYHPVSSKNSASKNRSHNATQLGWSNSLYENGGDFDGRPGLAVTDWNARLLPIIRENKRSLHTEKRGLSSVNDTMKTLILCKSIHHQNTALIAQAFADVLGAEVRDPDATPIEMIQDYDLIGLGSGIYFGRFHAALRSWISQLPDLEHVHDKAFIFSTSGLPFLWRLWHRPLRARLKKKGLNVIAEFHCRGFDTFGPLWLFGGLNCRHPNQADRKHAAEFARRLMMSVSDARSMHPTRMDDPHKSQVAR